MSDGFHHTLNAVSRSVEKILLALLFVCIVTLTLVVVYQVLARYTTFIPPALWTEEAARFLLIWMILLGSGVAVYEKTHFEVDLFTKAGSVTWPLVTETVIYLATLGFALIFLIEGYAFVEIGSAITAPATEINMSFIYVAVPIAALSWIVFSTNRYVDFLTAFRKDNHKE